MKRTPPTDTTDLDVILAQYNLTGDQVETLSEEFYGKIPTIGALDMAVIKVRFKGEERAECIEAFKGALAGFEKLTS